MVTAQLMFLVSCKFLYCRVPLNVEKSRLGVCHHGPMPSIFFDHKSVMPVLIIGSNIAHPSVQNWHRGKIPPLSKRSNTFFNLGKTVRS